NGSRSTRCQLRGVDGRPGWLRGGGLRRNRRPGLRRWRRVWVVGHLPVLAILSIIFVDFNRSILLFEQGKVSLARWEYAYVAPRECFSGRAVVSHGLVKSSSRPRPGARNRGRRYSRSPAPTVPGRHRLSA